MKQTKKVLAKASKKVTVKAVEKKEVKGDKSGKLGKKRGVRGTSDGFMMD